jgi:transcriptional regulator with XRE-family HTH domain
LLRPNLVLQRRKELGFTKKQLAEAADVSVDTIQRFEAMDGTYNPRGQTFAKVRKALGVSADDLLSCF